MIEPPPKVPQSDGLPAPSNSQPVTSNELRRHSQELGMFGKLFGSRDNAPVNISGALILLCLIAMFLAPLLPFKEGFTVADMEKTLAGLIVATFSFLAGYLGGSNRA